MAVTKPALRYHGAKFRLAKWVMQLFPVHRCYVEPFGGAAGVLLQKPRAYAEVYNDLDGDVVNFFRVLRDPCMREALTRACEATPYARDEFEAAWEPAPSPDSIERARRLAIRAQMGFGSSGATKGTTGFRMTPSVHTALLSVTGLNIQMPSLRRDSAWQACSSRIARPLT